VKRPQLLIGAGTVALAALLAAGAGQIHGEAGYAGVGPAFLPWLVSAALAVCGVLLMVEAWRAPAARTEAAVAAGAPAHASGSRADLVAFAWVSAGLLLNAALINRIGFVLSCAALYALAAHGFRRSMAQPAAWRQWAFDLPVGLAISAPVYWMFTKGLGLVLPGLTKTGWI
jgi:putative tricarboxylic transport membrane protein